MDYYSETQNPQADPYAPPAADPYAPPADPYAPPAKKQRPGPDNRLCPEDEVVILKEKVWIPKDKYPGYNFVGSILGPQGSILKELQKNVNAKIAIFGKGSMRKDKEAELLNSEDEKYAHLKEPLHVMIDIKAPRADAHRRMHYALLEVYKFMTPPDQGQQFNQGPYGGGGGDGGYGNGGYGDGGYGGGFGGPPRGRGGPRGAPRGGPPRGGPPRGGPGGRGGRGAPRGGGGY